MLNRSIFHSIQSNSIKYKVDRKFICTYYHADICFW